MYAAADSNAKPACATSRYTPLMWPMTLGLSILETGLLWGILTLLPPPSSLLPPPSSLLARQQCLAA
ncbi:hypothetical protein K445DRAFT_317675 [Daldinia sp. EC12]|nr:hypothetical protein K445DRAFT_317675 [Daldinia sp. EC12]